jgi:lysozyme
VTLREALMRDEGLRLRVYRDSVGIPTIGYGRNLVDKGISPGEAELLLDHDMEDAYRDLERHLPWATLELDVPRREALVNMVLNLGPGNADAGTGLLGFRKFLTHLHAKDYKAAAVEMMLSKWAGQVGPRARRLAQQILTGVRQ